MTNLQLLLSIGIPTITILVTMMSNNKRFDKIEARLDSQDRRIEELRVATDSRFNDLKDSSHRDALEIMRQMTALHERVAKVEAKQD